MTDAVTYVLSTLLDIYVAALFLRLALQWVRGDFRNPLAQFIMRITNPLVLPARRIVPSVGGIDAATVVVLLAVAILGAFALAQLACVGNANAGQYVILGLLRLVHLVLRTWSVLIILYVVMSWLGAGTYNPAANLLTALVEPVLAPLRRFIPTLGGLDISPVIAMIAIEFLIRLVPSGFRATGLLCLAF